MFADTRGAALVRALIVQLFFLLLSSLVLDGGLTTQACAYSSAGYWLGVLLLLLRRPQVPTRGDVRFIDWGLYVIVPVGVVLFHWVWRAKGVI